MSASPQSVMDQTQGAATQALAGAQQPGQDPAQILAQKEQAIAPQQQAITAATNDLKATPQPGPAQLPPTPNQPLVDPNQYSKFSAALVAMAFVAGSKSKGNWLGVSSSLNGALKGYIEGNEQKAAESWKRYQADYDKAIQKHKDQEEDYAQTINNKKLTINQMLTELSWKSAKYDDQYTATLARQKRIDDLYKTVFGMARQREQLDLQRANIDSEIKKRTQPPGGGFDGRIGGLMATAAEQGISLPAGFRSKEQQKALWQGLIDKNPGLSDEQIIDKVKAGQVDFASLKKETQTAAGIAGRVVVGQNELEEFVPKALEASNALPRGQFVPFNELAQRGEGSLSDPRLKALYQWTNATLNAYDVVAARGGTDKEKRAENRKNLETADSPETYKVALDVMMQEVAGAKKAAKRAEGRTGGDEEALKDSGTGAAAPKPYADPAKEARYQAWKQAHPDGQ